MRRAAGDVVGKTVAAQVRQAARHLGYAPDDWRVREAWYGRAGTWGAAALDELRRRFAAWREREHAVARHRTDGSARADIALVQQVDEMGLKLRELTQDVDQLAIACRKRLFGDGLTAST